MSSCQGYHHRVSGRVGGWMERYYSGSWELLCVTVGSSSTSSTGVQRSSWSNSAEFTIESPELVASAY